MDVANQNSLKPASKIIYVTPQGRVRHDLQQPNVKHVALNAGSVNLNDGLNDAFRNIGQTVQNERFLIQPTTNATPARTATMSNVSFPKYAGCDMGNGSKPQTGSSHMSCQVDLSTQTGGGDFSTKFTAGTQTHLAQKTEPTIFDEMKIKAGEAFRKLDMYQAAFAEQDNEKKSVFLPGTDSEYRTPGAHYRNKNGQIKRPMNAFMVWAREFRGKLAAAMPNATNSDISIKLGQVWSSLPQDQKSQYYNIAEQIKVKHRQDFPDWVYKPVPTPRKKDIVLPDNARPVYEQMTSPFRQHVPAPSIPFVNLVTDVNKNQSALNIATRIPVVLQPVTYQHVSQVVKEKLADKISGNVDNKRSVLNGHFLDVKSSVPVRKPEVSGEQAAVRNYTESRKILPQTTTKTTEHLKLGQLLSNPDSLHAQMVKHMPTAAIQQECSTPISNGQINKSQGTTHTPQTSQATTHKPSSSQGTKNNTPTNQGTTHKPSSSQGTIHKPQNKQGTTHKPSTSQGIQHEETRDISIHDKVGITPKDVVNDSSENVRNTEQKSDWFYTSQPSGQNDSSTCMPVFDNVYRQADVHQLEPAYGSKWLTEIDRSGKPHKPMYLELLDPFDPLMDCDFLYSELYPGCLHLDVTRWREYLDIGSDDDNDPLSLFQDDSEDDIKISPVPLKESLRRMCNAHVQTSASGDIITGDLMIPIPDCQV